MKKLTNKKHQAFCDEYLTNGMNASQAYMSVYKSVKSEAGARVSSSKLLTNTNIKAYIADAQAKSSANAGVTRDEIIADLKKIKDECKAKGEYPPHALKAIEILNKMCGFNEPDKSEIQHKGLTVNYIKPKKK